MTTETSSVAIIASVISGAAGIAGSLVQRWVFKRDEDRKNKMRKKEKAAEDVLMSDAAIVSEIKPMLDQLRKEVDYVRLPIRDGIATSTIWTPEARFYKVAREFYYSTLAGYISNGKLRSATENVVDIIDQFIRDTHNLGITRHYGEHRNPNDLSKEVTGYEERRKKWLEDFVKQHEAFLRLVAETVGYHRLRQPIWTQTEPDNSKGATSPEERQKTDM